MGARMAVAAGERHARLRQTQLRSDDMDDALVHAVEAEKFDAELCDVSFQRLGEIFGLLILERPLAHVGGHDVIDGRKGTIAKCHVHTLFPSISNAGAVVIS